MNRSPQCVACPDWEALERSRDDGAEGETAWMDALERRHECEACFEAALAVDPTLLFLDLPPVETSEAEIAAMQERVAISKRFSESVAETQPETEGRRAPRWLAAAAALVVIGFAGLNQPVATVADLSPVETGEGLTQAALPSGATLGEGSVTTLAEHLEALPLVEDGDVRYEVSGGSADYAVLVFTGVDL
ncbi:MAG: hypothetical protein AAGA81_14915 [Acidobacteriota bacterium]